MLQRPTITDQDHLKCPNHNQTINKVSCQLDSMDHALRLICPECTLKQNEKVREASLQIDYPHKNYTVSLLDLSPSSINKEQTILNNKLINFRYLEIEHIIVDEKSRGYSSRNLVYIPDQQVLVACSSNGHVAIWAIGEQVQWKSEFNVEKPINFAKYINKGESGDNHLILGIENNLNIYNFKEGDPVLVTTLNCEIEINDVEWISEGDKLASAGSGNVIQIWNLKTFLLERVIDLADYKIRTPIQKIIYLSHKNALVLGYSVGLSIVKLEEEKEECSNKKKPLQYRKTNMKAQGFSYLPQSRCFIIYCASYGVQLVEEENMQLLVNYPPMRMSERGIYSQILVNEDESQFMTISPVNRLTVYSNNRYYSILRLHAMVKENGVLEIIKDQHKVIIGDKDSGVIYILRTNAEPNSEFKLYGFEKDMENEAIKREYLRTLEKSATRKKVREETSRDQLKQRNARKKEEKPKRKTVGGIKRNNDGDMEIEEPIENIEEEKPVRKSRSRSKKIEDKTKDKRGQGKLKAKGRGEQEEKEEKMVDRTKSRRGKKK